MVLVLGGVISKNNSPIKPDCWIENDDALGIWTVGSVITNFTFTKLSSPLTTGVISSTWPTFNPIIWTPAPGLNPFTSLNWISIRFAEEKALPLTFKTVPTSKTKATNVNNPTLNDEENFIIYLS